MNHVPRSSTIFGKFAMSVRKIVTLTTRSRLEPPSENPLQVPEHLPRLRVEVAHADEAAVLIDRRLTGNQQQVADPEALRSR